MRITGFEWTEDNVTHIAKHGIKPEEAEEACFYSSLIFRCRGGRYLILGQSESGRHLTIVAEYRGRGTVMVVTAREMDDSERKRYKREKG